MKSAHIIIFGLVQGISYRAFAKDNADRLDIKGFVKNRKDGSVEIMAQGDNEKIWEFVAALRKGPPGSRVDNTKIQWEEREAFESFEIVR